MTQFKNFAKENIVVLIYFCLSFFVEFLTLAFMKFGFFVTHPFYLLMIILFFTSILLLIPLKFKFVFACIFLLLQIALNIGCVYLYDSNGTFFEWAMYNQRNDAFGTIEDLSLRWDLFAVDLIIFLCFIAGICLLWFLYYKKRRKMEGQIYHNDLKNRIIFSSSLVLTALLIITIPSISAYVHRNDSYIEKYLYADAGNKYQQKGTTGNAIYEFFNGNLANLLVNHDIKNREQELENFIYGTKEENDLLPQSEYFGISKDHNLVYVLVESFEWYPFIESFHLIEPEQAQALYPNLLRIMNDGLYASHFYAREKTDTAEMLALLGSNPTEKYINYDFPKNQYPYSLPNLFKEHVLENGKTNKQIKSFHQNTGSFYNRSILHKSLGFEELIDVEKMAKYGIVNHWDEENFEGERTPDSETIEKMQDMMFPSDLKENEQYMTFWITFAMHGYYKKERVTFKEWYKELDEVGAFKKSDTNSKDNYLRTYAAAVLDFDHAMGTMLNKLEENGQLENTTIVLFADHNTYYNNLSKYAKKINNSYNPELYRVPFLIYDQALTARYKELNNGSNEITKFATTCDLMPTIMDIFGIPGYKNLYFGSSVFTDDALSIVFSRAYGIFLTDKLMCYSAKQLLYTVPGFTKEDYNDFVKRAKVHLTKLEYLDLIYYNDYFKHHPYKKI